MYISHHDRRVEPCLVEMGPDPSLAEEAGEQTEEVFLFLLSTWRTSTELLAYQTNDGRGVKARASTGHPTNSEASQLGVSRASMPIATEDPSVCPTCPIGSSGVFRKTLSSRGWHPAIGPLLSVPLPLKVAAPLLYSALFVLCAEGPSSR